MLFPGTAFVWHVGSPGFNHQRCGYSNNSITTHRRQKRQRQRARRRLAGVRERTNRKTLKCEQSPC